IGGYKEELLAMRVNEIRVAFTVFNCGDIETPQFETRADAVFHFVFEPGSAKDHGGAIIHELELALRVVHRHGASLKVINRHVLHEPRRTYRIGMTECAGLHRVHAVDRRQSAATLQQTYVRPPSVDWILPLIRQ